MLFAQGWLNAWKRPLLSVVTDWPALRVRNGTQLLMAINRSWHAGLIGQSGPGGHSLVGDQAPVAANRHRDRCTRLFWCASLAAGRLKPLMIVHSLQCVCVSCWRVKAVDVSRVWVRIDRQNIIWSSNYCAYVFIEYKAEIIWSRLCHRFESSMLQSVNDLRYNNMSTRSWYRFHFIDVFIAVEDIG